MKKSALFVSVFMTATLSWSSLVGAQTQDLALTESQQQAFGLQFSEVKSVSNYVSSTWNGLVSVPSGQSHIMSAGSGGLLHLQNLTEGARIEPGQVLAQIDSPRSLTLQREALAVLSDLDLAKQNLARDEELADSGVVAQKRLQASRAEVANLSRKLDEVWQNLALMGMSSQALQALKQTRKLQSPRLNLSASAPGLVVKILASSGERVTENQPILQWEQTSPLWLNLKVSLNQAQSLSVGQAVALQGLDAQGEIIIIDGRVEPLMQSVKVVVALPQKLKNLRPGQSLKAQFIYPSKDLMSVPAKALIHLDEQAWLFFKQNQQLQALTADLLYRDDQRATVRIEGADKWLGTQVVSKGTAALKAILEGGE
ncbi:efflux RND transporter periplasmic adaptor subunit [Thiomicrospira pelophila]|uniref:efflux RND transporter periplasmic adaptor subunit n=1 Tax=Thiomicrospira pelophila TaxID=934 RepID=UPI0004A6DB15|nr:efflux RND transporter periplasmic adaptor subunit [Thiomicrospira pelophila]